MADWVSASTDEFWTESADCVYLGSGQWELFEFEVLASYALSPIAVAGKSVWGIRLTISGGSYLVSGYILGFSIYGDVYPGMPNPLEYLLDEVDRVDGEYVTYFDPGAWRGISNGYDNIIISDIELYTDWTGNGPEPSVGGSHLYKTTGQKNVTVDDPPTTNNDNTLPNSSQTESTSPLTPNPSTGTTWGIENANYKPPKKTENVPKPENNSPVTNNQDYELVWIPPNPIELGSVGYWRLMPKIPDGQNSIEFKYGQNGIEFK